MPFAGYVDFAECVEDNQDKPDPKAFCAWLHKETTGRWPKESKKGGDYMKKVKRFISDSQTILSALTEAATIKARLQGLLKSATALLEDRDLPSSVREEIMEMRNKLLKRWAEMEDDAIDNPVKESNTDHLMERGIMREAVNGRIPIVIIAAGPGNSKDKHYYPIDTLLRDCWLFEDKKMYVDHPTVSETKERPERSLRDWVATITGVTYNNSRNTVEAYAEVHVDWFMELIEKAGDGIGISINAVGSTHKGEIHGQSYNIVDEIVAVNSVDFVTEAAAGGRIKTLFESLRKEKHEMDLKELTLEQIKANRTDIIEAIRKEEKTKVYGEKDAFKEVEATLRAEISDLADKNKALESKLVEVAASNILRDVADAAKNLIATADLPEAAKARIASSLPNTGFVTEAGQVDTIKLTEAVREAVAAEKDYLTKVIESGRIRHPSGLSKDDGQLKEARKAAWKQLGYDDAAIKKMEEVKA